MRVAELGSGELAAAAAGGSATTTPASELQHQQQLLQQCSSLVAALASFVGAPDILDRLLAPLDALLIEDAGERTPRAHAVRADGEARGGARVGVCGARVPRHVRNVHTVHTVRGPRAHRTSARLFRLNSALARANERVEMSTASATATFTDEESRVERRGK